MPSQTMPKINLLKMPDPAAQTEKYVNMMNRTKQMEAAERQAAMAEKTFGIAEQRNQREEDLQPAALSKAGFESDAAQMDMLSKFSKLTIEGLKHAQGPEDAVKIGDFIKSQFKSPQLQASVDQSVAKLTANPANFEPARQQMLYQSMEADKQLDQRIAQMTTGDETYEVSAPKYAGAPGGTGATEVPGTRVKAPQGITYVKDDQGNVYGMPTKTGGGFAVGTPPTAGAPGRGNTADVVYGFGKFGSPAKPLSQSTIGEVQDFQRNTLIPNTRGKVGAGPDKGTGAVGTYQLVYGTLKEYAPKVLGANWRDKPFTADVQEQIAKAIYDDVKGGDLKKTWAGLPSNRPGQYANVPWEQVRDKIIQVESGGGRRTPTGGAGAPTSESGLTPVIKGSGKTASTEDERKISSNVRLAASAARDMAKVLKEDPSAIAPGGGEYAAGQVPFYGKEASKFAQSGGRQRFDAALAKFVLAATYITTGAGVAAPQIEDLRTAFFPTYQDTDRSRQSKLLGALQFVRDTKDRAGSLWTPELESELNALEKLFKDPASYKPKAGPRTSTKRQSLENIFGD